MKRGRYLKDIPVGTKVTDNGYVYEVTDKLADCGRLIGLLDRDEQIILFANRNAIYEVNVPITP